MEQGIILGMDLGTTNAKAAAYSLGGELLSRASIKYPTYFPGSGQAEQSPADWIHGLSEATRQVVEELGKTSESILGLSLSCHGPGLILVDENGALLQESVPTWQDERCYPQGKRLIETVGPEWVGLGLPLCGFPAKLLWAIEEEPELIAKARYALGIKGYLVGWLTGQFATEPSSGPGNVDWWEPVFDAIEWPLERLPPVYESTGVVSEILPKTANDLNLPPGIPVVIGINDGASTTLSSGAIRPGDAIVTLATNGVARLVIPAPIDPQTRLDRALFCWPYVENYWIVGGQSKAGASSLQWIVDLTSNDQKDDSLGSLLKEAAQSPVGAGGVLFLPYLMGRGSPIDNPDARGAFLGLTLSINRGDCTRAILEGVSFAILEIFAAFKDLGLPSAAVRLTGGGAQSELWRQIISDVLNLPVQYLDADATLGAAIMATVGIGIYEDIATATDAMCGVHGETLPISKNVARYTELYGRYEAIRDDILQTPVHEYGSGAVLPSLFG